MILPVDFMCWVWLGVMILCLIIEGATWSLTTVWAAIACLPLIFISRIPIPLQWQILIFTVLTLLLVVFTRPFALKKFRKPVKTNADALEGKEVPVTATVTATERGSVRLSNGTEWQALSSKGKIARGARCVIERIEGNTLIVKPAGRAGTVPAEPQEAAAEGEKK